MPSPHSRISSISFSNMLRNRHHFDQFKARSLPGRYLADFVFFFAAWQEANVLRTDHQLFKPHWISLLWFYWTYDRKIRSNLWKRDQTKYERPGQRRSLPTRWSARRRRREPYTDDAYMYWGGFSRNAASAATERARRIVPRGMSAGFAPGSTVLPAVKLCPTVTARFRRAAVEILFVPFGSKSCKMVARIDTVHSLRSDGTCP